jgi:hypothetical protein
MAMRFEEELPRLVERIVAAHEHFQNVLDGIILGTLGESLHRCGKCRRPMLPRRTWEKLSKREKDKLKGLVMKASTNQGDGECMGCHRNNIAPAKLAHLRAQVGLT